MPKCDICKGKIETTFLGKIKGTYIGKGKKSKAVCPACQRKFSKQELIKKLKL